MGRTLVVFVSDGEEVLKVDFEVGAFDKNGVPILFHTTQPKFSGIILFKECENLRDYLDILARTSPEMKKIVRDMAKNLPNPTCPDAVP